MMVDKGKIEEEIKQVAYEIYVQTGCIPGRDLDNWLEAEKIVLEKYGLIKRKESHTKTKSSNVKKSKKRENKRKTSNKTSSSKRGRTKSVRKTKRA